MNVESRESVVFLMVRPPFIDRTVVDSRWPASSEVGLRRHHYVVMFHGGGRRRGGHGDVLTLVVPQSHLALLDAEQQVHDLLRQRQRLYCFLVELYREVRLEVVQVFVVALQTLDGLGAAAGGHVLGLVQELAAFSLDVAEAGRRLLALDLAAHLEALEYVPGGGEVESFLFGLNVLVVFGSFGFGRARDARVAF